MDKVRDCMKSAGILLFGIGVLLMGIALLVGAIRKPCGWSAAWVPPPVPGQALSPGFGGATTNRHILAFTKQEVDTIKAKMKQMGWTDEQIDEAIKKMTNTPIHLKQTTVTTYKTIR